MSLVRHRLGPLLHFAWIFNANLVFGRQRQRCPDARIGKGSLAVSIKGHFDLYSAFNGCGVPTGGLRSFLHRREQLLSIKFIPFAGRADKTIASATSAL